MNGLPEFIDSICSLFDFSSKFWIIWWFLEKCRDVTSLPYAFIIAHIYGRTLITKINNQYNIVTNIIVTLGKDNGILSYQIMLRCWNRPIYFNRFTIGSKKPKNATILHCGVYHRSSAFKLSENTLNEVLQKLISQKKWSHYAQLFWWLIFYPRFHVRSSWI